MKTFDGVFKGKMSSNDAWMGHSTIYGVDGEHKTAYMTRLWIGRLRLHIFHRGDNDPDPHDHPWPFWTFPLTSYIEEVTHGYLAFMARHQEVVVYHGDHNTLNVVRAFRWTYQPATHMHRVLCRTGDNPYDPTSGRKIVTFVWRGKTERKWGFLKNRDGKWCWTPWKDYISNGGKNAPCE